MEKERVRIYAGALAAMLFWGASFVWTKVVFRYYGPFTTVFIRLILSTLMLAPFILMRKKRESIDRRDIPGFMLLAFFEPFCYFIGEHLGIVEVSPTLASVMIALIPVVTPVFTFFILNERLTGINLAGLFISFAGVAVFVTDKGADFHASPKGILLLSFAVLSGVAYGIAAKRMSHKYSPLLIVSTQNLIGACYFIPLFLFFEFERFKAVRPNGELVTTLIMLSLFGSTLAFLFMTKALKELGVTRTNIFTNMIPLFTAIRIAAIFVVIGGIFLSQIRGNARPAVIHED